MWQPQNPNYQVRCQDSFSRQPLMAFIGAILAKVEPGVCEIHLPYRKELTQQHGYLHGGSMAMLLDATAGYTAFTLIPEDATMLTVESKLNMLRPGIGSTFIGAGQIIKAGKTLTIVQADLYAVSDTGKKNHCATSIQTLMTMVGMSDEHQVNNNQLETKI
ncbi:MAG: PaaI family thioesterase [Vampirovibrio sp.]|nr:PaaI family thioesterase [Vampirovibrio sp.]